MSSSQKFQPFETTRPEKPSSSSRVERSNLQLASDDQRWEMRPPWGWFLMTFKFRGFCWYCGTVIEEGARAFYSRKLRLGGHYDCKTNMEAAGHE